jgi:hypothetical protein
VWWTNGLSQASLNELFFPVNIDWNRFPVESVLRALDPVLGITSVFPLVWAHLGLKLVEFVEKKSIPDVLVNILMRFR